MVFTNFQVTWFFLSFFLNQLYIFWGSPLRHLTHYTQQSQILLSCEQWWLGLNTLQLQPWTTKKLFLHLSQYITRLYVNALSQYQYSSHATICGIRWWSLWTLWTELRLDLPPIFEQAGWTFTATLGGYQQDGDKFNHLIV